MGVNSKVWLTRPGIASPDRAILRPRRARLGFVACGIAAGRRRTRVAAARLDDLARRRACTGRWTGWRRARTSAPRRRRCGPRRAASIALGMSYAPARDPLALAGEPGSRADFGLCARGGLSRRGQEGAQGAGALAGGRGGRRRGPGDIGVKVFVDTAPVMEKPLGASGGARLAGQAHQPRQPRPWLLAVPRRDLHHARAAARRARGGPLRLVHRLPGRLPDRRLPRALPARCAALHQLPDDRAQGADPGRVPQGARQPHLRLRRLPGGLPVEQVRRRPRSANRAFLPRAELAAPRLADLLALDDAGFRRAVRRARRSSGSGATGSCATACMRRGTARDMGLMRKWSRRCWPIPTRSSPKRPHGPRTN